MSQAFNDQIRVGCVTYITDTITITIGLIWVGYVWTIINGIVDAISVDIVIDRVTGITDTMIVRIGLTRIGYVRAIINGIVDAISVDIVIDRVTGRAIINGIVDAISVDIVIDRVTGITDTIIIRIGLIWVDIVRAIISIIGYPVTIRIDYVAILYEHHIICVRRGRPRVGFSVMHGSCDIEHSGGFRRDIVRGEETG